MRSSVKWIFAASLGINIFLVGLVLGRSAPPPFPPLHGGPPHSEIVQQLPEQKREAVEQMEARMHQRHEENFEKIERTRKEVVAILEAPVFDEANFIAKSKELDAFFSNDKQQMIADMAALAKGFNQKERHILAEQLRRPPGPPLGPPPMN